MQRFLFIKNGSGRVSFQCWQIRVDESGAGMRWVVSLLIVFLCPGERNEGLSLMVVVQSIKYDLTSLGLVGIEYLHSMP